MNKRKHSSSCSGLSIGPLFLTVVLIAAAAWYISGHWFQLMVITGASMSPTYHSGQFTAIDRRDRSFGEGDVVALRCENLHAILVKRIAAGPGDTVVITGGHLLINGRPSPVYGEIPFENAGILEEERTLSEGSWIVFGDNIAQSRDSRDERVGIVQEKDIIGKIIPQKSPELSFP